MSKFDKLNEIDVSKIKDDGPLGTWYHAKTKNIKLFGILASFIVGIVYGLTYTTLFSVIGIAVIALVLPIFIAICVPESVLDEEIKFHSAKPLITANREIFQNNLEIFSDESVSEESRKHALKLAKDAYQKMCELANISGDNTMALVRVSNYTVPFKTETATFHIPDGIICLNIKEDKLVVLDFYNVQNEDHHPDDVDIRFDVSVPVKSIDLNSNETKFEHTVPYVIFKQKDNICQ